MPSINLQSIIYTGLVMAFMLPLMAYVLGTLPVPNVPGGGNLSNSLNATSSYIYLNFNSTLKSVNSTLIGNKTGGLNSNPTIFQSFAFIVNGFGTIITDVFELPYLDFISLQTIIGGMSTVLPGIAIGFIQFGATLLYAYMLLSMLLLGVSMIEKYNALQG